MSDANREFQKLVNEFTRYHGVIVTSLFGYPCLKYGDKAFLVQQDHSLAFKLSTEKQQFALSLFGASTWDPMQDGMLMDEWVLLPLSEQRAFQTLARASFKLVNQKVQLSLVVNQ